MKAKILLFLIVLLAFFLRFYRLDQIPPGINRDEASIGYNAYSILKTGRDEHGAFLPLSFQSFGDWKLPVYIYLDTILISIFGLNEFAVRFPSALFGTLTVLMVFLVAKEWVSDKKKGVQIGLFSALFLTLSPWHIHFSRAAYEANVAAFFLSVSAYFLFKGLKSQKIHPMFSIFLGLTLLTYHAFHVFAPLFFLGILFLYRKSLLSKWKSNILSPAIFTVFFILAIITSLHGGDSTKIQGTSYFFDTSLNYVSVNLPRIDHDNNLISKILHNKLVSSLNTFTANYLNTFSPEFLLIQGGTHPVHNIPGQGNMLFIEFMIFFIGIYFLLKEKPAHYKLLLLWLLLSPIAAAITKDAPHSTRSVMMLPVLQLLAGYGVMLIVRAGFSRPQRRTMIFITFIIIIISIFNFVFFLDRYFVHFPLERGINWYAGYKEMVSTVSGLQNNYQKVVIDGAETSPYIYLLFYQKYDPLKFQKEALYYAFKEDGIVDLKSFDKYEFRSIDWQSDVLNDQYLTVGYSYDVPVAQLSQRPKSRLLKTINLPNGSTVFQIVGKQN